MNFTGAGIRLNEVNVPRQIDDVNPASGTHRKAA